MSTLAIVRFSPLLIDFDGAVGADASAHAAGDTSLLIDGFNVLITLGIDVFAHSKHLLGAELDAVAAALAALCDDFDHCHRKPSLP
jgi:hypothetical protein